MRVSRHSRSRRGETQPLLSGGLAPSSSLPPPPPALSQQHPQERASLLSRIFITWLDPLLRLGNARQLQPSDVWPLAPQLQCEFAANLLHRHWIASGSLSFAFLRSFGWRYIPLGALLATAYGCDLVGPYVLFQVVDLIERAEFGASRLVQWLALLLATRVLKALLFAYVYAETQVVALQFASALKSIVFQKALRLSTEARARKSTAEIVGIYTTDVQSIVMAAYYLHEAWVLPLALALALLLLGAVVSWAALAGLGVIALVLALTHALARAQARTFAAVLRLKDERMKVVRELFAAVQIVKLHAWERKCAIKIAVVRARELHFVWRYLLLGALHIFALWGAPVFVSTATFAVYALALQQPLTATTVFTALALFRVIQDPLRSLPRVVAGLLQAGISARRLVEFIDLGEVDPYGVAGRDALECVAKFEPQRVVVAVEHATFAWDAQRAPLFRGLHFTLARGEFAIVHGPVGSGKSSLCALLLGDMVKRHGAVYVGGAVAYCSQQPWLQSCSVRANIVFGRAFDPVKYDKVLDACGLAADLATLPAGDCTEIGERGLSLSGSQRARIALARACYSDADVYVLDSPLAVVDACEQHELFTKCLLGLLKHKTRVLVTQNADIIASKFVDTALRLDDGVLTHSRNIERQEFVHPPVSPLVGGSSGTTAFLDTHSVRRRASRHSHSSGTAARERERFAAEAKVAEGVFSPMSTRASGVEPFGESDTRLLTEQARAESRVAPRVFLTYVRAVGGVRVVVCLVAVQCAWQALQILSDFWLVHWTNESADAQQTRVGANLLVYVALALSGTVMVLVRTLTVAATGLRGARALFDRMTAALLRAPLAFFDATSVGRILSCYSDDVSNVDFRLPLAYGTLLAVAFANGCALLTAAAVTRFFGLLIVPLLFVYVRVGAFYVAPARALQRLQTTSQTSALAHVTEAIEGTSVIRAFGREQTLRCVAHNFAKVDASNRNVHASVFAGQWFALRMQLLGAVLVVGIASALVALRRDLSAGVVGLALSYALAVDQGLESLVQSWSWLETSMGSPERMHKFIDVAPEAPDDVDDIDDGIDGDADSDLPLQWPTAGHVVFENVSFRYATDDALVLRDVSLDVQPSEKIGIVGRAGAGKSSLAMALFRVNELAAGRIVIDGVDIKSLRLATLRSALSIIPQTPVLFRGSVRAYLDPFDEFADDDLWRALRTAGLSDTVAAMDGMLYAALDESGESVGVGERQLLCVARALLSESRVVVLDDATATSDHEPETETHRALQRVIRDAFQRATVFTIARRLDAVLDADRILVLDTGRMAELDAPHALLARRDGFIYDLAREGGYLDRLPVRIEASD